MQRTFATGALLAALATVLALPAPALGCPGDCNGDAAVSIDELVRGVGIALGSTALDSCPAFDGGADGAVSIDELIAAVNAALGGCEIGPAPRPTPTAAPGDCCAAHAGAGCAPPSCQQCVCNQLPECCEAAWDDLCVAVAQGCYPDCDCPIIIEP